MRHRNGYRKLNRTSAHRLAMLRNMSVSLLRHEAIKTTLPKAKEARKDAEKMVTLARKGNLAARRLAASRLQQPKAVQKLFDEIVPAMEGRKGGYTRILKLGARKGDAAPMCLIQWVVMPKDSKKPAEAEAPAAEAPAAAEEAK